MTAPVTCRHFSDRIDDIHAVGDFCEHGVTEVPAAVVEKIVVAQIDKKLRGRAVYHSGAGHRECAHGVRLTIVCFVLDRVSRRLAGHVFVHATALNHEVRNNAMPQHELADGLNVLEARSDASVYQRLDETQKDDEDNTHDE